MSVSSWNGRGLGTATTINELRDFAREHAPSVLCVVETQLPKQRVEGLARTLGYDRSFAISSSGRSGGIGIFWNNDLRIEILPYSQCTLDAIVSLPNTDPWRAVAQDMGHAEIHSIFVITPMVMYRRLQ
jgi:exonuclease III